MFTNLMKGKIGDPTVQKAFDYWSTMTSLDKWIALPPRTPEAMVRAHRAAYEAASAGTDFAELGVHEYFEGDGVCLIEWADKVPSCLPAERLEIRITITGEQSRRFEISGIGERYEVIAVQLPLAA